MITPIDHIPEEYLKNLELKKELIEKRLFLLCDYRFFSKNKVDIVSIVSGYTINDSITRKIIAVLDTNFIDFFLRNQIVFYDEQKNEIKI